MGFAYDSMEDEFEFTPFQDKVMNLSMRQLKQRNWLRRKAQKEQKNPEEAKQEEKKQDNDDYGVEEFN